MQPNHAGTIKKSVFEALLKYDGSKSGTLSWRHKIGLEESLNEPMADIRKIIEDYLTR